MVTFHNCQGKNFLYLSYCYEKKMLELGKWNKIKYLLFQ